MRSILLHSGQQLVIIVSSFSIPQTLFVRDMTVDRDTVSKFIREGTASAEVLKEMSQDAKNEDLAVRNLAHLVALFLLAGLKHDFICPRFLLVHHF